MQVDMPKIPQKIRFTNPTMDLSLDPNDLGNESLVNLENMEETDQVGLIASRNGIGVYTETVDQFDKTKKCEILGHGFASFNLPIGTDNDNWLGTKNTALHLALVEDNTEYTGYAGLEPPRGRFIAGIEGQNHTWKDLITYGKLNLSKIIASLLVGSSPHDTGTGTVVLTTIFAHGLSAGDKITIAGTIYYNGDYTVIATPDSYKIEITIAYNAEIFTGFETVSLRYGFGTQLGNINTLDNFSVQGYPISGHKIGYNALPLRYMSNGNDAFGPHTQFGLGGIDNTTYPLMLQFINRPYSLGDIARGLGFFAGRGADIGVEYKQFQGWYFSKSAPTSDELYDEIDSLENISTVIADATTTRTLLPPGTYKYYVSLVLDGVNETEHIKTYKNKVDYNGVSTYGSNEFEIILRQNLISGDIPVTYAVGDWLDSLSVNAWDAFCKRITHIKVYREYVKGTYSGNTTAATAIDTRYKDYISHGPRELCTIPINNAQNSYGDRASYDRERDFVPNPELYTVYNGAGIVRDDSGLKRVVISDLVVSDTDKDFYEGLFASGTLYIDYKADGSVYAQSHKILAGLDTASAPPLKYSITLTSNLSATDFSDGDVIQIRIGSSWAQEGLPKNTYKITVLDQQYDWAAGELSYVSPGTPRRPNWLGRTLINNQAFVWDIWEDRRPIEADGIKRYRRRIRYTVARDRGYPTVFYDGILNISGDEKNDPIMSVIPVDITITNDSVRAIALVCGRTTTRLMTVVNGDPTVHQKEYPYGLAGPKAFLVTEGIVYGMGSDGLMWLFSMSDGFSQIGLPIQKDVKSFSDAEKAYSTIGIQKLGNAQRVIWWEGAKYTTEEWDAQFTGTYPIYYDSKLGNPCDDVAGSISTLYADYDRGMCFNYHDLGDAGSTIFADLTRTTVPKNYGFRHNIASGSFNKRTSITSDRQTSGVSGTNLENYQLLFAATNPLGNTVWGSRYSDIGGSELSTLPYFAIQKDSSEEQYDSVPNILYQEQDSDKRGYYNKILTRYIDVDVPTTVKYLSEVIIGLPSWRDTGSLITLEFTLKMLAKAGKQDKTYSLSQGYESTRDFYFLKKYMNGIFNVSQVEVIRDVIQGGTQLNDFPFVLAYLEFIIDYYDTVR